MTAVPPSPAFAPPTPYSRGMAFLGYFLLLAAIPTLGSSALIALVLAYARRDGAGPLIRSHHRFQIRIFWIAMALTVAGIALGFSAWLSAGDSPPGPGPARLHIPHSPDAQAVSYHPGDYGDALQPAAFHTWSYSFNSGVSTRTLIEGYAAMLSIAAAGLWSIAAPLWGLLRLASGRPIGHSAR